MFLAHSAGEDRDSDTKVFWFFSSEKNCLTLRQARLVSKPDLF
jgi:hypothetical protein